MLAGIKFGKKKIKTAAASSPPDDPERASTTLPSNNDSPNTLAANQLRELLQQQPSSRIPSSKAVGTDYSNEVLSPSSAPTLTSPQHVFKEEKDLSVLELLKQEKSSQYDFAKQEMKSILNQKKKRGRSQNLEDDDDDVWQSHLYSESSETRDGKKHAVSSTVNIIPRHRLTDDKKIVTSSCPWWIQSSNFSSHRLITPPQYCHVTASMAPPSSALFYGEHFYICPIEYTPSLTACDDNVWQEIRSLQSMLSSIARRQEKGVLFWETVLESRKTVWQTRLEAVFVPRSTYLDASLYFRSALQEMADENSTYTKLISTNASRTVRNSVPKQFPYFYVEYDDRPSGYIMMIESSKFPKDFGVDTIASMMHMDPIRFRSQKKHLSVQEERQVISSFMKKYETVKTKE